MIRSFLTVPLLALGLGAAACGSGDTPPANAADAPPSVNPAADSESEPASATGTARIRISGARSADLEGEAHVVLGKGMTGVTAVNLNLAAVADGVVHVVSVVRMSDALPAVGLHPVVGIDAFGEPGSDPGGVLASYGYGRGTSAEALAQDVSNLIDSGYGTAGELTVTHSSADRLAGSLRFRALLDEDGGEVTVEATFDAPRVAGP